MLFSFTSTFPYHVTPFWNPPEYDIPEVTSKNKLLQHLLWSCQHPGRRPPVLCLLIRQVQILAHATLFIKPPFHLPGVPFSEMIKPESTQYLFRKCPLPVKLYSRIFIKLQLYIVMRKFHNMLTIKAGVNKDNRHKKE